MSSSKCLFLGRADFAGPRRGQGPFSQGSYGLFGARLERGSNVPSPRVYFTNLDFAIALIADGSLVPTLESPQHARTDPSATRLWGERRILGPLRSAAIRTIVAPSRRDYLSQ